MAPRKIRVLVVDDSVVMRRILSDVVGADPALEVAGCAANGQIALSLLKQLAPDIVTLDVEMPVMDGLATLRAMRAEQHTCPVIMFSSLTERGAEATIDSLALGASDYVTKPLHGRDYHAARECIRASLVPKIKVLCSHASPVKGLLSTPAKLRHKGSPRPEIVVIGSSTGGPNALAQVLPQLPEGFPLPVLVVQHMPPLFTHFLAQRLTALCRLPVAEAVQGDAIGPGKVWIAPGNFHMSLRAENDTVHIEVMQLPPENFCRPSADVLFRSACQVFSHRVLAVVLTGMGQDALRGCELLADAGAHIVVQDEATSVVWGMPGFVARAGLADAILPISEVGAYIARVAAPSVNRKLHVGLAG